MGTKRTPARTARLTYKLLCDRRRWPEAHAILRRERAPAELHTTAASVIIRTNSKGAHALQGITTPADEQPEWTPPPRPKPAARRDRFEEAFARARERIRAEAREPESTA